MRRRDSFLMVIILVIVICLVVYNFKKYGGKCNYYDIGTIADPDSTGKTVIFSVGLWGVLLRLFCYFFWALIVAAIIAICPNRQYFWSWLGQRTMSTFIWHKFVMIFVLYLVPGKIFLAEHMVLTRTPAVICIAIIAAVLTAYLPGFRIAKNLRMKKKIVSEEIPVESSEIVTDTVLKEETTEETDKEEIRSGEEKL